MRRGLCKAFALLLASTGLALSLSPEVFAQAPLTASVAEAGLPEPSSEWQDTPLNMVVPPALPQIAEPMLPEGGEGNQGCRWYAGAEYLLWWFRDSPLPVPLLTTTANPGLLPLAALGNPGTSVLLGNQELSADVHQGARFTAGQWIDDHHQIAVEGSYFFLANQTVVRTVAPAGTAILAVPFINEDIGAEDTFVLASPGLAAGAAALSVTSRLQGADIHGAVAVVNASNLHVDVLAGFRFLELAESLAYATASTELAGPNTGLILNTVDHFNMRNVFYGWQVGARADYRFGSWQLGVSGKLALGDMVQTANINGVTATNFFSAPAGGPFTGAPVQSLPGMGLFVQPSNFGHYSRDRLIAFAPEVGVTAGYQLTSNCRLVAGYDSLYLSKVLRPGDQIDRGINFSQTLQSTIAGNVAAPGTRPAPIFVGSDFWAQGAHLGLDVSY